MFIILPQYEENFVLILVMFQEYNSELDTVW